MKTKTCAGVVVGFSLLLMMPGIDGGMSAGSPAQAAGSPVVAAESQAGSPRAKGNFSVGLTVEDALGVSLDGETSSDSAIRIGDPAAGVVSYVILDG